MFREAYHVRFPLLSCLFSFSNSYFLGSHGTRRRSNLSSRPTSVLRPIRLFRRCSPCHPVILASALHCCHSSHTGYLPCFSTPPSQVLLWSCHWLLLVVCQFTFFRRFFSSLKSLKDLHFKPRSWASKNFPPSKTQSELDKYSFYHLCNLTARLAVYYVIYFWPSFLPFAYGTPRFFLIRILLHFMMHIFTTHDTKT
jgi:hypothetical protein